MLAAERTLAEDLRLMKALAFEAGELALQSRGRDGWVSGWEKSGGMGPVTNADLAVDQLCRQRLTTARPAYGWLSEETPDDLAVRACQRVWVVDPIDGTRAFMKGRDDWCIALAVVEEGTAVAGVVYAPSVGRMYEARRGAGAFLNGQAIAVSRREQEAGSRLIASEAVFRDPSLSMVELARPRPNATQLRMALVSSADWDGVVILSAKADWDLAAGTVLITEAGGQATTHQGNPLVFNRPVPAQQSVVASGNALHPLLVRRAKGFSLPDPQAGNLSQTA